MSHFEILPRFREFVLLFGLRHLENEVGPPRMRFRRRTADDLQSAGLRSQQYTGFGNEPIYDASVFTDLLRMCLCIEICRIQLPRE